MSGYLGSSYQDRISQTSLLRLGLIHVRLASVLVHLLPLSTKLLGDLTELPLRMSLLDRLANRLVSCVESVARPTTLHLRSLGRLSQRHQTGLDRRMDKRSLLGIGLIHVRLTSGLVHLLPLSTKLLGDLTELPLRMSLLDRLANRLVSCVESVARTCPLLTLGLLDLYSTGRRKISIRVGGDLNLVLICLVNVGLTTSSVQSLPLLTQSLGNLTKLPLRMSRLDTLANRGIHHVEVVGRPGTLLPSRSAHCYWSYG